MSFLDTSRRFTAWPVAHEGVQSSTRGDQSVWIVKSRTYLATDGQVITCPVFSQASREWLGRPTSRTRPSAVPGRWIPQTENPEWARYRAWC